MTIVLTHSRTRDVGQGRHRPNQLTQIYCYLQLREIQVGISKSVVKIPDTHTQGVHPNYFIFTSVVLYTSLQRDRMACII